MQFCCSPNLTRNPITLCFSFLFFLQIINSICIFAGKSQAIKLSVCLFSQCFCFFFVLFLSILIYSESCLSLLSITFSSLSHKRISKQKNNGSSYFSRYLLGNSLCIYLYVKNAEMSARAKNKKCFLLF